MEVAKWREKLSGISYHEWQRLRFLVDQELDKKISECERQLALGLPDETTANLLQFG